MTNSFDPIAEGYYNSTPAIPQQYLNLLQKTFHILPEDRIIDLGCGSGELALTFAKQSSFVEGLDASGKMIEMAKEKDKQQQ
ncbi:MAG: methyltransferase domain-containing protein [Patescibacteria group bacterium]